MNLSLPEYISPAGVADMIPGMTEKHLAQLRHKGGGPIYLKPTPKIVLYRTKDVVDWIESSTYVRTNLLFERMV